MEVVRRLRAAGHEALWAGGCVRDQLLGRTPKDYDVATNATPDTIREIFGHRRTLALGAAFGVIAVLGTPQQGQVEVATFREDATYSDGRRPDRVTFSTAEQDAQRRDFTINGLFYDPLAERIIDYVGGENDLRLGVVRAIGDPAARIAEDKLRMLRAVRFTATFNFTLDQATFDAVRQHAADIHVVSAERIADEMRRMLVHATRVRAVELLSSSGLLHEILPEVLQAGSVGRQAIAILAALGDCKFPVALAALLREAAMQQASGSLVCVISDRWRLSNDETHRTAWLLAHEHTIRQALDEPWRKLQRLLIADGATELLQFAAAIAAVVDGQTRDVDFCRERLSLSPDVLNPEPLISGDDLKAAGIPPGKVYQKLLEAVRDAQLEGRVTLRDEALAFALQLWRDERQAR